MGLYLKPGVSLAGAQPALLLGLMVAVEVWRETGTDLWVTSINDGVHSWTSLHWSGAAADLRTKNLPLSDEEKAELVAELGRRLGRDFDVLLEDVGESNEHCHLEWQPRRRE